MFRVIILAAVIGWTGLVVGAVNVPDASEPRYVVQVADNTTVIPCEGRGEKWLQWLGHDEPVVFTCGHGPKTRSWGLWVLSGRYPSSIFFSTQAECEAAGQTLLEDLDKQAADMLYDGDYRYSCHPIDTPTR